MRTEAAIRIRMLKTVVSGFPFRDNYEIDMEAKTRVLRKRLPALLLPCTLNQTISANYSASSLPKSSPISNPGSTLNTFIASARSSMTRSRNAPSLHISMQCDIPKLCILAGSRVGDTVLDPFAGSGTVGKVAMELGRKAVLIELNPAYIELAEDRTFVTPGFL
jgi:DNA methylase